MSQRVIRFSELRVADLIVDAIYEGGSEGNNRDDPIYPLLNVVKKSGMLVLKTT